MKIVEFQMRWLRFSLVILIAPLAGCAVNSQPATYQVDTKGPYKLDTGDTLRVTVYGDPQLSTTYKVDDSGSVPCPWLDQWPYAAPPRKAPQRASPLR